MPQPVSSRATPETNVVPAQIPAVNVRNADPTVQRTLQQQAETINRILNYLNKTFTRS